MGPLGLEICVIEFWDIVVCFGIPVKLFEFLWCSSYFIIFSFIFYHIFSLFLGDFLNVILQPFTEKEFHAVIVLIS